MRENARVGLMFSWSYFRIQPSQSCGPFRMYSNHSFRMYHGLVNYVYSWDKGPQTVFFFIGTGIFVVPLLILLMWVQPFNHQWIIPIGHISLLVLSLIWTYFIVKDKDGLKVLTTIEVFTIFISSPEPKAWVSFSDKYMSLSFVFIVVKLFDFSSSSPEPLGQFQANLAQSILG